MVWVFVMANCIYLDGLQLLPETTAEKSKKGDFA